MKKNISVGWFVKRYIKMRNYSMRQVADMLGIKYTTFSGRIGRDDIDAHLLFQLANLLDMDLAWMAQLFNKHRVIGILDTQKEARINRVAADFEDHYAGAAPLTKKEKEQADAHWENGEYFKFLPFAYRLFRENPSCDNAFDIAQTLSFLCQYDTAIDWYRRACEIGGEDWRTLSALPYLYQQIEEYEKSSEIALKLLAFEEAANLDAKHEIYSVLADNCFWSHAIEEAIGWLNKILEESHNESLIQHTKKVKEGWIPLL